MGKSSFLFAALFLLSSQLLAQKDRYVVFFKDKNGTPYSLSSPQDFLSPRAVQRRTRHSIPVLAEDLPVNPAYIQAVRDAGAEIYFRSRWMNAILIQCEPELIPALTALSPVERVELVAPKAKLKSGGRKKFSEQKKGGKESGVTDTQLSMLGIDEMHKDNFRGEDVVIAILDSGFEGVDVAGAFQHLFQESRINLSASKDFVYNSGNVFQYDDHGTEVFSVISGYQPSVFTGGAYKATFQLYVTEEVPTEYRVEEYNWLFAAERADSAGVDIIHSSLGYYDFDASSMDYLKSQMNGSTTVVSRAAQWAADRGIVVVTSAGNEGNVSWQIITAPADARDVLAVGNVDAELKRANSSSTGPSADQRTKPDVAALGVGTSVVEKTGAIGKSSGTSLAAPLVTSLVAGIVQRYPMLTNKEILDAVRMSASQASKPDFFIGYGIPNYRAIVNYLEPRFQERDFEVFPNPIINTDSIIIRPKNPAEVADCVIELISSDGKTIFKVEPKFSWASSVFYPDVSKLAAGIYYLRINSNDKRYTYKLIKP